MIVIPESKVFKFENAFSIVTVIGHKRGLLGVKSKTTGFITEIKINSNSISEKDLKNQINEKMKEDKYVNKLSDISKVSVQILGAYIDPDKEEKTRDIWDTVFTADYECKDGLIQ
jgi:hypothetical protein